ncbi:pentatricopeptide repeat-containing protein At1g15510, chloroplastic-like [Amaranthus tricolor]|uniref:pentatricopeptide repeat-containing protein At1g15510, chloroplastic-like n=1 Tax=Amaranthus tricolor TaxID=29722 RepID=UPI00258A8992|nr:pentatricopeptide repeat-containing protein At1g15510, chloroplastic-like [Amaranthus tricolor]
MLFLKKISQGKRKKTQNLFFYSLHRFFTNRINTQTSINVGNNLLLDKEKGYFNFLRTAHKTSDLSNGKAIHTQLIKKGCLHSSIVLRNFLLNMYIKFGDLDSAVQLFDEMPHRNVVSWSTLIAGFVRHGFAQQGLQYFSSMFSDVVRPNEYTLVTALNACFFTGFAPHAYQIYAMVIRLGFDWNVFVKNAFLTALIKNGHLMDAIKSFDGCLNKDIVSWNAMISGYLQFLPSIVPSFWLKMIREGVKPDGFTFSAVLSGLTALGDDKFGMQMHGQLVKFGHGAETCVGNSVMDMYLKLSDLVNGLKSFDEIKCKNILSWTAMATGCLNLRAPSKALEILGEMKMAGIRPNKFSLTTALKACADMASLEEGQKAHGLRIKLGTKMDVCVDNALLDMYVKCGCVGNAMSVFKRMKDCTTVTWTTMVMGFAQNGRVHEAVKIFNEMVTEGVKPNYISFVCVLYACSQGGLVSEGWKYFSLMTREYDIFPGEDHYICMVDLLGRTGYIKEAEALISKMPMKPGPLVWQTLLGACHIHGDFEAGKRAAECVVNLKQSDPSTYILLSNMLANLNHWKGAKIMRDMMKSRSLSKLQGASSLTSLNILGSY